VTKLYLIFKIPLYGGSHRSSQAERPWGWCWFLWCI